MERRVDLIKHWNEIWTSFSPRSMISASVRRPLTLVLLGVILWIVCWYDPPESALSPPEGGPMELVAQIEALSGSGDDIVVTVNDVMTPKGERTCDRLQLYASSEKNKPAKSLTFSSLKIGNIIRFYGTVRPFQEPGNPGQFNEKEYYLSQGIDARMFVTRVSVEDPNVNQVAMALYEVRCFFRDAFFSTLPEREAGILTAMVLGEKSELSEEVKELYRENGIAHILAISGLHISMIGAGLFFLLRRYLMPMHIAAIVTGMVLILYGQLTGFSLSTRRAVLMMLLMLVSRILIERFDRMNALALAAIVELVYHPLSLYQSGFLLSYGTVFGILLFVDRMQKLEMGREGSAGRFLYSCFAGSFGVFFVTLPILIQSYHEVPVFSVIVNAVLLPFMGVLLGAALIGGGVTAVFPMVGRFIFGIVYYILQAYQQVCEWVTILPGHSIIVGHRSVIGVVFYYMVIGVVSMLLMYRPSVYRMWSEKNKPTGLPGLLRKRGVIVLLVLILNVILMILPVTDSTGSLFPIFSRNDLTITNLDVGQGDCSCIRLMGGETVLIDGGSSDVKQVGKYRIVPFLEYMGIDTIDYMIVTHSDSDHVSGLMEILEDPEHFGLTIRHVVLPKIREKDEAYRELEEIVKKTGNSIEDAGKVDGQNKKGDAGEVSLIYISAGDRIRLEDATFTCLHPTPDYRWEDVNDYSTVIQLNYGDFTGLFTGDLGFHGEESMEQASKKEGKGLPDVDYLKVGHHGSKNSSSKSFLSEIRPEIAVASAGENNRYHHPAKEAVERLESSGATFFCTIDAGAVTTRSDGKNIRVETFRETGAAGEEQKDSD